MLTREMGISVTPSAVVMGWPTMVLVSAISRILSIVERIRSLRGLFLSIVSSMGTILSRHAA